MKDQNKPEIIAETFECGPDSETIICDTREKVGLATGEKGVLIEKNNAGDQAVMYHGEAGPGIRILPRAA